MSEGDVVGEVADDVEGLAFLHDAGEVELEDVGFDDLDVWVFAEGGR